MPSGGQGDTMPNSDQGDVLRNVDATCSKHPEETGRLVGGQLVGLCEGTGRRVERELAAQGHDVRMGMTAELDQLLQDILEKTRESMPADDEVEVVLTGFLSR